ncbi:hypothetical protein CEXT_356831 [Caerostris extrusa]|uniref:Uncharacterized protein n=1 Tax=Caerostris extrusa TaxID=172846 RepID=A0AAV4Y7Z0_CAEEX|nr:hypothetical protein CEXT_356831 [Caerostris extrusa]
MICGKIDVREGMGEEEGRARGGRGRGVRGGGAQRAALEPLRFSQCWRWPQAGFTYLEQLWRTGQLKGFPQLQNGGRVGIPVRKTQKDTRSVIPRKKGWQRVERCACAAVGKATDTHRSARDLEQLESFINQQPASQEGALLFCFSLSRCCSSLGMGMSTASGFGRCQVGACAKLGSWMLPLWRIFFRPLLGFWNCTRFKLHDGNRPLNTVDVLKLRYSSFKAKVMHDTSDIHPTDLNSGGNTGDNSRTETNSPFKNNRFLKTSRKGMGHDKRGRTFRGASLLPDSQKTTPPSLPSNTMDLRSPRPLTTRRPPGACAWTPAAKHFETGHRHHSAGHPGAPEQQPPVPSRPRALGEQYSPLGCLDILMSIMCYAGT